MKPKPKVGDILYSLNVRSAARHGEQCLTEVVVTNVGRRYFKARSVTSPCSREVEYCLDNWIEHTEYLATSRLYANEQEWHDDRESSEILRFLCEVFGGYAKPNIPLDDLRTIREIVERTTCEQTPKH